MELLGVNEPECSVGCPSRIKAAKVKEPFSNEKCSAQRETIPNRAPYWWSPLGKAKLGSICKSASEGSFPPTISPRKLLSLDNEALDNGILYPLSLNGLNSQGVSMATAKKLANSNGFYDCDKTETTSEKAVGYGRPRSWSQPVGLSLRCKRFNSGEKMNRENCSSTKTDCLNGITWNNGLYSSMAKRNISARQKMNGCYQGVSLFTPRLMISKQEEIPHESRMVWPFRHSPPLNSKDNNPPVHGIPPMHREPFCRHEIMPGDVIYKETSPIVNGWQQYSDFASREFLDDEPNHVGLRISELFERESSYTSEVARDTPSAWTLNDPHARKGRTNPGVIGGEIAERRRRSADEIPVNLRRNVQPGFENRPRKEARSNELVRPRTRSSCHGSTSPPPSGDGFSKFCFICKTYLVSEAQVEEHLRNTRHLNKLAKYNSVPYKKFCEYCKVHLNSESQANEHFSSGRHEQTVAKSQKAPIQQHLPLITTPEFFSPITGTSTDPLGYQLELYCKAMESNGVCFLPTGTGKELVASLVIAHMLQLNPSRQVIFLVDRVLLVLQQSDYLRKELRHLRVPDVSIPGKDSPPLRSFNQERPIRIGAVCGEMRKLEGNARIYEQDVLIITADCYRNHLNNGTLRFEDVSLLVLDDAHHCNKDHPYNVIIRDFYLKEDAVLGHRPKILGLTASLAGESSLDKTTKRLQRLLGNLGAARLMIVEENINELQNKTTVTAPVCVPVALTRSERELMEILMEYLTKAFNAGVRMSELKEYKDIFQPSSGGLFSSDDIFPVLRVIDNILLQSRPESNALSSLLHFQLLCEAVCTLQECGASVALDQLVELVTEGCPHGFEWAENNGLPCNRIKSSLEEHLRTDICGFDSGVRELIEQLLAVNWTGTSGLATGVALVLVKRNRTAHCLAKYLSSCTDLLMRGIRTTCIAGHGGRSCDRGVGAEQKDVIRQIRSGCFQVVVATNAAKDNLELAMCDLVIQMDPMSSVAAIEQIRSGILQRQARSLSISRNDEQARKIDDLLKREENMKISARLINGV